jgi:hypothetical protein
LEICQLAPLLDNGKAPAVKLLPGFSDSLFPYFLTSFPGKNQIKKPGMEKFNLHVWLTGTV